jgi:hypothetical protein
MTIAEQIVDDLLEGKVGDWISNRWQDIKTATGIGHDQFGMGKPEKGFKPKYGATQRTPQRKSVRRAPDSEKTWNVTP